MNFVIYNIQVLPHVEENSKSLEMKLYIINIVSISQLLLDIFILVRSNIFIL